MAAAPAFAQPGLRAFANLVRTQLASNVRTRLDWRLALPEPLSETMPPLAVAAYLRAIEAPDFSAMDRWLTQWGQSWARRRRLDRLIAPSSSECAATKAHPPLPKCRRRTRSQ
jgi:hypothetical protein